MQHQVPESHRRDEDGREVHYTDLKTVMQATGSVAQRRAMKVRLFSMLELPRLGHSHKAEVSPPSCDAFVFLLRAALIAHSLRKWRLTTSP